MLFLSKYFQDVEGEIPVEVKCLITINGKAVPLDSVGHIYSQEEGFLVFARLSSSDLTAKLTENAARVCGSCDSFKTHPLFGARCEDEDSLASSFSYVQRADSCDCWKAIKKAVAPSG